MICSKWDNLNEITCFKMGLLQKLNGSKIMLTSGEETQIDDSKTSLVCLVGITAIKEACYFQ